MIATAYTQRGTVIGTTPDDPGTRFDHTSILATLEARFGLAPLTERDRTANTLAAAINQNAPRLSDEEAPSTLPTTADYGFFTRFRRLFESPPVAPSFAAPLTSNQHAFLALAMACDIEGNIDPTFAERRSISGVGRSTRSRRPRLISAKGAYASAVGGHPLDRLFAAPVLDWSCAGFFCCAIR